MYETRRVCETLWFLFNNIQFNKAPTTMENSESVLSLLTCLLRSIRMFLFSPAFHVDIGRCFAKPYQSIGEYFWIIRTVNRVENKTTVTLAHALLGFPQCVSGTRDRHRAKICVDIRVEATFDCFVS